MANRIKAHKRLAGVSLEYGGTQKAMITCTRSLRRAGWMHGEQLKSKPHNK